MKFYNLFTQNLKIIHLNYAIILIKLKSKYLIFNYN